MLPEISQSNPPRLSELAGGPSNAPPSTTADAAAGHSSDESVFGYDHLIELALDAELPRNSRRKCILAIIALAKLKGFRIATELK